MNVTIGCRCASAPHEHDTVTLRETLSPRDAMAISKDISVLRLDDPEASVGDILAVLTEGYILRGVEAWSLIDEAGEPLPVTKTAIRDRILSDLETASTVGDVADELYAEAVMLPLLRMASTSSSATPTAPSTSAPTATTSPVADSGSSGPRRSKPSSISTTPTDVTATMSSSPGGDSSFSPTSASAA